MKITLRFVLLPLLLLCLASAAQATHLFSGYISYASDPQNPRKFNFVFTLYTSIHSQADDPFVSINMGDGNTVRVERKSVTKYSKHYDQEIFTWTHTYAGNGDYTISWTGENRNAGIINVAAPSDLLSFKVITRIKVSPFIQNLNGAKLANAPLTEAYTGEPWTFNLLAYDADGDYLVYDLITPKYRSPTADIANVPGYRTPEGLTVNEFGELHWENPGAKGQYVIALQIRELRDGIEIGSMVVDMTFSVTDRTNQPRISLLNKDRLTINDDGSIQTWPGEPVKLEFYQRRSPNNELPLNARPFGELDTLQLVATSLAVRDTVNGFALTYTFTPTPELERTEPYLIGMRGAVKDDTPASVDSKKGEFDWAFTYLYVGEQRRPLSSGEDLPPEQPKLYPNPVRNEFTIEAPNLLGLYLQVRDITGKVVAGYALKPGRNDFKRPAKLAAGIYTFTLSSSLRQVSSGKLVLQ